MAWLVSNCSSSELTGEDCAIGCLWTRTGPCLETVPPGLSSSAGDVRPAETERGALLAEFLNSTLHFLLSTLRNSSSGYLASSVIRPGTFSQTGDFPSLPRTGKTLIARLDAAHNDSMGERSFSRNPGCGLYPQCRGSGVGAVSWTGGTTGGTLRESLRGFRKSEEANRGLSVPGSSGAGQDVARILERGTSAPALAAMDRNGVARTLAVLCGLWTSGGGKNWGRPRSVEGFCCFVCAVRAIEGALLLFTSCSERLLLGMLGVYG